MGFLSRNIVVIIMVPVIVASHYGWYKLQDVKSLVSPHEREKLPIISYIKKITGEDQ